MWKLPRDLKVGPDRWIALDPLYTLIMSLTSFLALYKWNFSNTQPHLVVKELGLSGESITRTIEKKHKSTCIATTPCPPSCECTSHHKTAMASKLNALCPIESSAKSSCTKIHRNENSNISRKLTVSVFLVILNPYIQDFVFANTSGRSGVFELL